MPSLTSYTPFETLKLCQSIAQYGSDAEAFDEIATTLNTNDLIRDSGTYDASRLTPAALQSLYDELLHQESEAKANGEAVGSASPRKRKASTPQSKGEEAEELIHTLVDKLYARFREEAIKEIKEEEDEYLKLQQEITQLEAAGDTTGNVEQQSTQPSSVPPVHTSLSAPQAAHLLSHGTPQPLGHDTNVRHGSPLVQVQQQPSPGTFNRSVPSPVPGRGSYTPQPVPPPQGYPMNQQSQPMMPYPPGIQQMPPPMDYQGRKGSSSASTPARGSPVPQHPQQYPQFQQYQHPPQHPPQQWQPPYAPQQHQYPPQVPYPPQGYYVQSPGGRPQPHYPPPHQQQPYPPYPPGASMAYQPPPPGWHHSPSLTHYAQTPPAMSTPRPDPNRQSLTRAPGSSTPWKRRQLPPNALRPPSPTRPDRGVSPFSDTETDPAPTGPTVRNTPKREAAPARRGRPPNAAASRRSQSVASQISETPTAERNEQGRRTTAIKAETPSTPLPESSESATEQRSSGRRGRPRANTAASIVQAETGRSTATNKRKRSSPVPESATPPPSASAVKSTNLINSVYPTDRNLLLVSKNFAKTSQLILNEITSHKLGGVFAKPLTERDAPGYKDLVLRPQDLKSIKTSVGRGSRAAIAAIEALELPDDQEDHDASKDAEGQGPVGNGFYHVKKSEELEPPRGIVNAAQLQVELMRVFANAVMFNPLPSSERGFGYNLRVRKRGGDVVSRERDEPDETGDDDEDAGEPSSTSEDSDGDAGDTGIIADAREMFEDVCKQVKAWRELEKERQKVDSTTGEVDKGRQGSVASVGGDEVVAAGVGTPTAASKDSVDEGRGTLRKRRRLAD